MTTTMTTTAVRGRRRPPPLWGGEAVPRACVVAGGGLHRSPAASPSPSQQRPRGAFPLRLAGGRRVACRAEPRRIARLEKQFAREMANLLCYDEVLLNAMSPYREYSSGGFEDLMMAEVTEVTISSDLQFATVYLYLSDGGADGGESSDGGGLGGSGSSGVDSTRMFAFENLQRKVGYIRKELARKVKMRRAPEVRLVYDKNVEEQEKIDEVLAQLRREREAHNQLRREEEAQAQLDADEQEFLAHQDFYIQEEEEEEERGEPQQHRL